MKKKMALCMAVILCVLSASTLGEIVRPMGLGQMGYDAVVLSKSISIRPTQNANAKAVKKLNYGARLAVMPLGNGWCECYLSDAVDSGLSGYALEDYLVLDPAYLTTEESTPVYAWQSTKAKKVGLLGRGETYPIIRMEGDWLLISLRGAAGWVVRPSGDATGTARLRTADARRRAEKCLLASDPWTEGQRVTAETLLNYYTFVEFDASTRMWNVTFDTRNNFTFEVTVNDSNGEAFMQEGYNG